MENRSENEETITEVIANPVGIPGNKKDSEKIRKEHRRWKTALEKKRCKKVAKLSYWQKVSMSTSL